MDIARIAKTPKGHGHNNKTNRMKAAKNEYKFENNEARDRNLRTGAVIEFIISVICLDNAAVCCWSWGIRKQRDCTAWIMSEGSIVYC